MRPTVKVRDNQSGIASIVIVVMIMIILSVITLGFSQIIRREQRRSFDRQLSSQAFYAAESGVNDAVKAITEQNFTAAKTECDPLPDTSGYPAISGSSNKLTADGNVMYNCLLIDPEPTSLIYDNVDTDKSIIFPIQTADNSNLDTVFVTWQAKDGQASDNFRNAGDKTFPTESGWDLQSDGITVLKKTGLIRLDIIKMPLGASFDRATLLANTKTYFLYPNNGAQFNPLTVGGTNGIAINYNTTQDGEIVTGTCNAGNSPNNCLVRIDGLNSSRAFARIRSVYRPSSVEVMVLRASNSQNVRLINAQTLVDSTGRAAGVSRRVQVRVPTVPDLDYPENVLSSMNTLCKRFSIIPNVPSANPPGQTGGASPDLGDPSCQPNQ